MTPLRLVIVGCGAITANSHLPSALRSSKVEVTALVDSDVSRAAALLRQYVCQAQVSDRLEKVLDRADGVLIATPNHTHAAVARIALGAGIPVLIEKPITTTYEEALRLCEFALENKTFISVGFRTRHQGNVQLMKRLIDDGYFGTLRSFHYEFGTRGGWAPLSGYNLNRASTGGGVLVVTGTHILDRLLYWFGDPEIVEFQDDSRGGVEANCKARLRFQAPGGPFEGTFFFSKTVVLKNRFTLDSDLYRCEWPEAATEEIKVYPKDRPDLEMHLFQRESSDAKAPPDYFLIQLDEFADCVRAGKPPLVDGWFAARSVKLTEELYACRTELPEPWVRYGRREKTHGK
ncbi:MAG: Gfo/Idh/MocA family oxidoreductase [Acidobacteria bacterium]|nr:Gfo/Idh/MocA family oxidoreductase [Acidobacteriota bacterium]